VLVTCDPRDRENLTFKDHPTLIVEVLSDSTEGFDRGDKFKNYRSLESLKEYVVVSQTQPQVDCFRRNSEGQWVLYPFQNHDTVHLESVNLSIDMDALYEDVIFPEPKPQQEETQK
jgi:Uma2 family endonuclease